MARVGRVAQPAQDQRLAQCHAMGRQMQEAGQQRRAAKRGMPQPGRRLHGRGKCGEGCERSQCLWPAFGGHPRIQKYAGLDQGLITAQPLHTIACQVHVEGKPGRIAGIDRRQRPHQGRSGTGIHGALGNKGIPIVTDAQVRPPLR